MPWRQSTIDRSPEGGGRSEGASLTDFIFDGTGISAAANYAGTQIADWMPMHQEFFKLQAGPFLPQGTNAHDVNVQLSNIAKRIHAVSARPQVAALEMFYDHFAGTGAMFLEKGDQHTIINPSAVPVIELALEEGPWGDIWHIYWKRRRRLRDIEALWPNGNYSDQLKKAIKDAPRDWCETVQYTWFDPKSRKWRLTVWCDKDEEKAIIHESDFNTAPWQIPRMFKVPGEPNGRGLAHLALPFVKTANRGRELALKAAVFAILGVWIRRNESTFNPDTAVFDPGAMWAVSDTGGPRGASISRLPVPQDFDITSIVMNEEREQIRRVLLDDELPPETEAVRSATEVAGRMRRHARNRGGTGGRLSYELITPYVQRVADILHDHGMLGANRLTIDQIVTQCIVTGPAAAAQRIEKVERAINWIQMIVMLLGPGAAGLVVKMEELLPEIGRWMGNDEEFIRGKEELKGLKDLIAQLVAAEQTKQAEAKAPAPSPQQPYVNGAAM